MQRPPPPRRARGHFCAVLCCRSSGGAGRAGPRPARRHRLYSQKGEMCSAEGMDRYRASDPQWAYSLQSSAEGIHVDR
jgi:hypothetical protein